MRSVAMPANVFTTAIEEPDPSPERWVPRAVAAEEISRRLFIVSPRTLEEWSLPTKVLGRKAHVNLLAALTEGRRRIDATPTRMGGRIRKRKSSSLF